MQARLDRYLLTYRATPTSLGRSPSELLLNRQPRLRLSALRSSPSKQGVKIFQENLGNTPKFSLNQPVFARNFGKGAKWLPGSIAGTISPRNFDIQVGDVIWKRHEEQLRPRCIPTQSCSPVPFGSLHIPINTRDPSPSLEPTPEPEVYTPPPQPAESPTQSQPDISESQKKGPVEECTQAEPDIPFRRYPTRERRPPDRFY